MSSGRHDMIQRHNMSQWVKTTDLCFKTDYESVIFSDGSYHVRGSYYVYHWMSMMVMIWRSSWRRMLRFIFLFTGFCICCFYYFFFRFSCRGWHLFLYPFLQLFITVQLYLFIIILHWKASSGACTALYWLQWLLHSSIIIDNHQHTNLNWISLHKRIKSFCASIFLYILIVTINIYYRHNRQPRVEEDTELVEDQEDVHAVAAYYAGTARLESHLSC